MDQTPAALWPFVDLRVSAGDLELRYLDDELALELAELAGRGLHGDTLPFCTPWSRGTPTQVARSVLAYQWGARSRLAPADWRLELAVVLDGRPVGIQSAFATDYPITRTAETGSWLGREHQGRGTGRRMRRLMLHLLFEELGALRAESLAWADNPASLAVTRALGYTANGSDVEAREGVAVRQLRYVMDRAAWAARDDALRPDVRVQGAEGVRVFLEIEAQASIEQATPVECTGQ